MSGLTTAQLHAKALARNALVMEESKRADEERRKRDQAKIAAAAKGDGFEVPKKKKKKFIPTNMFEKVQQAKPVGQLQKIVVDYLKKNSPAFVTTEQILKDTQVDILGTEELRISLDNNMRVAVKDGKYGYQSRFKISNSDEIMNLVSKYANGLKRSELKDAYSTIEQDIDKLIEARDIICLRNDDKRFEVLFPRYHLYGKTNMPDDIKQLWSDVRIPDQIDLQRALIKWGMKKAEDNTVLNGVKVESVKPVEKPKARRKRKFVHLTNTHIKGFNMNDDIVDPQSKGPGSTATW